MEPIGLFMQIHRHENGEYEAIMLVPADAELPQYKNTAKNIDSILHIIRRLLEEGGSDVIILGL